MSSNTVYRAARPLLDLGRSAAMRPQTLFRASFPTTARRIPATTRGYAGAKPPSADMRMMSKAMSAQDKKASAQFSARNMEKQQQQQNMANMLLPGTFVPLPLASTPKPYYPYLVARFKQLAKDLMVFAGLKLQSMPKFWKRPRAQFQASSIVPTAKALHQQLAEAIAAGDKTTLRQICVPHLYETLSATISRRKTTHKLTWELLAYDGRPKLLSHRLAMLPPVGKSPLLQQAVVGIVSSQRVGRVDKQTGKPVPSSTRVEKLNEYLVLSRSLDPQTYKPGKWIVWGNTKVTTMERWKAEETQVAAMEAAEFERRRGFKA
ncbi:hypothetical protein COL154_011249 [Colletotrichum chrysophilum]|uniref:uncharacterized protein n=1 Tax=Colletotrichum chrysophilum TaxID=1836956 RepID=UPI002300569A|nr:uncharacterized protein COL26b_006303 [Colletotrichum chrysophilum]KAJ0345335.1 hypothetical protein KNSL1_008513 [Colletotrichum chrysophilum]KAJ0355764.1 hypothetical protein COL154_011249 [Colletotrichum chrysophilum]KAJ0375424.1 hypothetical protein COL26b_006303 [Colletotrichum chrysophilum]